MDSRDLTKFLGLLQLLNDTEAYLFLDA